MNGSGVKKRDLVKIHEALVEIPQEFRSDMRVPARIFTSDALIEDILDDRSLDQIVNVATLPGIKGHALAMPDIHQGYGFPIGGVAAMAIDEDGVISPGGIGYDINCGVRLLGINSTFDDAKRHLEHLADGLYHAVPSGVGRGGDIELTMTELDAVLAKGAAHMLAKGYGVPGDLEFCEEGGFMANANPSLVSSRAKERGLDQLGTLGSGNHFLEVQRVDEIYDQQCADIFGLHKGMLTVMIHCGSRGLGHQVCTDYVSTMNNYAATHRITLADRELACAPFSSKEGQDYFAAMAAAANFAWANRHMIGHAVRQTCRKVLGELAEVRTIYDVSHNIGKVEKHKIDGAMKDLIVHRKGATRAFGPGREEVPLLYRSVGHPVLIPGTMGTASYVLAGTDEGMAVSFGSSCHGAGRRMSRLKAKKSVHGAAVRGQLEKQGIIVRCDSSAGLAEEAPMAYKDVNEVVRVVERAGIARIVAKMVPVAVVKGG